MSLVEPGDLNHQLRSARSWMKESVISALDQSDEASNMEDSALKESDEAAPKKPTQKKPVNTADSPLPQSLKQNQPSKMTPMPGGSQNLAAGQYDRMIEDMIRNESEAEIIQHVIKVERSEVAALVKQVARAKGRYLATLLESSKGKSVPSSRIEDLKQLRDTHEELLQGLNDLRRHILDGTVMVEGVRN